MPCTLFTLDTHTGGEPTRIVIGGLAHIPGESMQAKKSALQSQFDWVRRSLMREPRGHRDMFGAVITPPVSPDSVFGVVFMDGGGYLNMCGHGSIGVVTAASYLGWLGRPGPSEPVRIDTPAGLIEAHLRAGPGGELQVGIANVPAFVAVPATRVALSGGRAVDVAIAFGGSFFALVDAAPLGFSLSAEELPVLTELGLEIRAAVNREVQVRHPLTPEIDQVDLVEFYLTARGAKEGRNVVIFGDGQVDRSPCGTGTCAKMASLHHRGQLRIGDVYRQAGILGTVFEGTVAALAQVGPYAAIRPVIYGSAHVTGTHQFILDPSDPFVHGFTFQSHGGDAQ